MDRNVVVGFSKPKNRTPIIGYLFSWGIRLLEGTGYSHVYVRWYVPKLDVNVVYEASGTQVKMINKERVFDHYAEAVEEYSVELSEEEYGRLLGFCLRNAGVSYGGKAAVGVLWPKIGKRLGKKWKNPFRDGDYSWFCNEMIGTMLKESKEIDIEIDLESTGPKTLRNFMTQWSGAKRIL